ncbi:MAG: phospholipid/cholesterol/gamma-HCH transport system substrate-binding protein [Nocardioidaceae bacterium]|jgi:phospholipid/cholesterol/gamma-HCH transport system substrate-binding protein|nr:phospholipid/cholesterol/gamma-HCH transport system substrate-binding protein [Nocardioidaceae bacterium]
MSDANPLLLGIVGTIVIVLLMGVSYRFDQLPLITSGRKMSADFAEIGGLRKGAKVIVSGAKVGEVGEIRIDGGHVRVDFTLDDKDIVLGEETKARIVTLTLLGEGALEIDPGGAGNLKPGATIPMARTSSPYDITQALSQLTTEASDIDTDRLTEAIGTISSTIQDTPDDLKGALRGVTKVAKTIDANDAALSQLLSRAKDVSGTLAERNDQIATLLQSGDSLLAQLNAREQVIVALLEDATSLSRQLSALVKENRQVLKPALAQLDKVVDQLNANKKNLQQTIDSVASYATELGEAVSTGPFFDAYIQNLTAPQTLAPVLSGLLK